MFGFDSSRDRRNGDAARDRGRWPEAVRAYRRYLAKHPDDFAIWVQCGHAEKEQGRFSRAAECYSAAARLQPHDADLSLQRGHLEKIRGNFSDAAAFYRHAVELNPSLEDAERELRGLTAHVQIDESMSLSKDSDTRGSDFAQGVVERDPSLRCVLSLQSIQEPVYLRALAAELDLAGRYIEACQVIRMLVWLNPESADLWQMLSAALQKAGCDLDAGRARSIAASLS
ncbi:tetratricopeptide repeat protein [Bosea sp. (in: a-proteobacteria)]|uniref:tetratricopeptide repeat protein n=1 Tax=Bosea sp. (in: a-proteobacteria) TaxID=1871050 RepID=UPI003F727FEC